jgi:hypothetical protein
LGSGLMDTSEQCQRDEQTVEFGVQNEFEFSIPYFDDDLIHCAYFTPRPMELQNESGTDKSFT